MALDHKDQTAENGGEAAPVMTLVVQSDDGAERRVPLGDNALLVGRASGNDVVLEGADKGVSRRHAELRFDDGRYVIVDLESQNGTWVNGERVHRAVVVPGAEIVLGVYRLRIEREPPARVYDIPLHQPDAPMPAAPDPAPSRAGGTWMILAVIVVAVAIAFGAWKVFGAHASPSPASPVVAPPSDAPRPAADAGPAAASSGANETAAAVTPQAPHDDAPEPHQEPAKAARATPDAAATAAASKHENAAEPAASAENRTAAAAAFDAAVRLDAAGDWLGAQRKLDEARVIDPTLPDLDRTAKHVADELREAANDALRRAMDDEQQGHLADAVKEYRPGRRVAARKRRPSCGCARARGKAETECQRFAIEVRDLWQAIPRKSDGIRSSSG